MTVINVTLEVAYSYDADIDFHNLGVLSSETVMKITGSKSRPTGLYAVILTNGWTDALKKKSLQVWVSGRHMKSSFFQRWNDIV